MPFELLKKQKISLGAKNVFALIAAFRRHGRRCFAQTRWFADQLGVSESSVRNYIKSLIEAGLIERDGDGCYHVIWEALGLQKEDNNSDEKEKFCAGDRKICGIYNILIQDLKDTPLPPLFPPFLMRLWRGMRLLFVMLKRKRRSRRSGPPTRGRQGSSHTKKPGENSGGNSNEAHCRSWK